MSGEVALSIYMAAGVAGVVAVGFAFPPIIPRESEPSLTAEHEKNVRQEFSYCRSNLSRVNCACFASKASQVLAYDRPEVRGMIYADRSVLARDQAVRTC